MDKKEQFENWLENTKSLSIKSCKNYSSAVTKISKDLIESGKTLNSLYDISDHSEIVKLSNIYWTPEMIKKDKEKWKRMYSNGFRHYLEFSESINSEVKITAVKDRVINKVELSTNINKPSIVSRGEYVRTQPEEKLVMEENKKYTRKEIWQYFNPNYDYPDGGSWFTGYTSTKDQKNVVAFLNIGVAGRTGHDFENSFDRETQRVTWFGKPSSHSNQPLFEEMLNNQKEIHIFARWADKDDWEYLGIGYPHDYEDDYYIKNDPKGRTAIKVELKINSNNINKHSNQLIEDKTPQSRSDLISRLITDPKLRNWIKNTYRNTCQICSTQMKTPNKYYSEAAHIRAKKDEGLDSTGNILCLCANCHALFDQGAYWIDDNMNVIHFEDGFRGKLYIEKSHKIDFDNIRFHREKFNF